MQGTVVTVPVQDTGEAFKASLAGALNTLLSAIPRIIGFAVVLIVGWIISSLLARGVQALLHAVRFNDLARRSGFADFVEKMGIRDDASGVLAGIVKWIVRVITLVVAFDTLGLPAVSSVLSELLLWLPNLIVALVVLVIGGLAANALSRLVRGASAEAGFTNPQTLEAVTRAAVWGFAIVIAISQLGIATALINTLVVGVIGAMALAFGLAFGLGGRERAAQILDTMGRGGQRAGSRLAGTDAVRSGVQSISQQPTGMEERTAGTSHHSQSAMRPGWVERSQSDRRRVERPGLKDRRSSNGSSH